MLGFLQQLKAEAKAINDEIAAKERVLEERRAYLAAVQTNTEAVETSIVETEAVYKRICDGAVLRQGHRLLSALQCAAYKEPGYCVGIPWDDYDGVEFYHGMCFYSSGST